MNENKPLPTGTYESVPIDGGVAEYVGDLATALALSESHALPAAVKARAVILPDGPGRLRVEDISRLLPKPPVMSDLFIAQSADAFVQYVNRFGSIEHTVVFADAESKSFEATLDYHADGSSNTQAHKARYAATVDESFKAWTEKAANWMTQQDFAEFVEEHASDIVEPPSAKMLEVATALEGTRNVVFKSGMNLTNGDRDLKCQQTTTTGTANGAMQVPGTVTIRVPVFRHDDPVHVRAILRYRILESGEIRFRLVWNRLSDVVDAAFTSVCYRIEEGTAGVALHFLGTA